MSPARPAGAAQHDLVDASRAAYARRAAVRRRLRHTNTDTRILLDRVATASTDVGNLRLLAMLTDLPGIGPQGASRILTELDMDGSRRLRSLTAGERERLADRLDAR